MVKKCQLVHHYLVLNFQQKNINMQDKIVTLYVLCAESVHSWHSNSGIAFIQGIHCHTRAPSWILSKAEIWQVPACKMEPRSGYKMQLGPPTHHHHHRISWKSLLEAQQCWKSGSFNVVRCPHPNCSPHQQSMCSVPPFQYMFILCGVPPHWSSVPLPHLAMYWILSVVGNMSSCMNIAL